MFKYAPSITEVDGNSVSVSYASTLAAITSTVGWTVAEIFHSQPGSDDVSQNDSAIEWDFEIDLSSLETMIASEDVLRRDWDTPTEDTEWAHL